MEPDSHVETFAAVRLEIDSWRWQGVPFYIRAGKHLPVTCVEVFAKLRRPPAIYNHSSEPNYLRFRLSPEVTISLGAQVMSQGDALVGDPVELLVCNNPATDEMDAYERLLGEAMKGDMTLFAREDTVEAAWRIVEPVLGTVTPVYPYDPDTWGPNEAKQLIAGDGGWHNPIVTGSPC